MGGKEGGGKTAGDQGFMLRLLRDRRGNTMAIMAASIIPFAGMAGGGLDLARLYLVKTRLQHACDAGALAGRKAMGGGQWTQSNNMPRGVADQFFLANFAPDSYGSTNTSSEFSESAGKVTGNARATVPMTLMRVLGFNTSTLDVTCEAEMRLPNTDVMFVLDTTGSMNEFAARSDRQNKIAALRSAVKCFYEIVQRLDTDEVCLGDAPSGGISDQVQVRFGFVPYATNANVGRLLPPAYLADEWTYQSREFSETSEYGIVERWVDDANGNPVVVRPPGNAGYSGWTNTIRVAQGATSANCSNTGVNPPPADRWDDTRGTRRWPNVSTVTDQGWEAYTPVIQRNHSYVWADGRCVLRYRERLNYRMGYHRRATAQDAAAVAFPIWVYRPVTFDISALKTTPGMASVWLPLRNFDNSVDVTAQNTLIPIDWAGCIEERETVRTTNFDPIPAGAHDLDLATPPNSSLNTKWAPALPGTIYGRRDANGVFTRDEVRTFAQTSFGRSFTCPTPARKLGRWNDARAFSDYVDSLAIGGNTYHDIGLIWGARLMWPTGIFRAENEFAARGGEIQRHLIFMTDGESVTGLNNYNGYGFAAIDRRQTDPNVVPTDGNSGTATLTEQVNLRTQAVCKSVRNENITLWVIWFGAPNRNVERLLNECATPGRFFAARNAESLQTTFRDIADQISQLRVTN